MLSSEGDELSANNSNYSWCCYGTESCDWASMLTRMYLMWVIKEILKQDN